MVRESENVSSDRDRGFVVMAIFRSKIDLEKGVASLKASGFMNGDVSALIPQPESSHEFAHTAGTKAPEGVTVGAATGAVTGGGFGWLVGAGAFAAPGFGVLIAAGPIVAALAGLGVGGTLGGVAGGLVGFGFPEYEAKRYEGHVREGGYLLSVHCIDSDWRNTAKEILERAGAVDIAPSHEARSADGERWSDETRRSAPSATV
jgi:hypothetical protein